MVRGIGTHHRVPLALGEHARRGHARAGQVRLDTGVHDGAETGGEVVGGISRGVGVRVGIGIRVEEARLRRRRQPVVLPVQQDDVDLQRETGERSSAGQPEGPDDSEPVDLGRARMPDGAGEAPGRERREQSGPRRGAEELGVRDPARALGRLRVVAVDAQTLTGPARAPRPTSSIPATTRAPPARSSRSTSRCGTGTETAMVIGPEPSLRRRDVPEGVAGVVQHAAPVERPDPHE